MRFLLCCAVVLLMCTVRLYSGQVIRFPGGSTASPKPKAVGESCIAGKDLVVQALELLRADSSTADVEEANQRLRRANDLCSENGEAWYFRSVLEDRLGHAPRAAYAMRQAVMFPTDALKERLNPFVLSTPPPHRAVPVPPIRERWALVIGVGTFIDKNIKALEYTADDATAFRDLLVDEHGGGFSKSNVRLLTNDNATLEAVKENLNWLARSAAPEDLVVVYIASHGSSRDVDTAGANYILTHDTKVGADRNPDTLYASALPMVQLADDIATRFKSRRTAVFLDTCYSGGAIRGVDKMVAPGVATASVSKATLEQISQGSGRIIFAASRTDQESLQSTKFRHGYFTYYLMEALKAHPATPLTRLFAEVKQHVSMQVDVDYELYGLHQTPVMSRSADDVDFALGPQAAEGKVIAAVRGVTR